MLSDRHKAQGQRTDKGKEQPGDIRIKRQVISRSPSWWVSDVWIDRQEAKQKKYGISTISKTEQGFNNRRSEGAVEAIKPMGCCRRGKEMSKASNQKTASERAAAIHTGKLCKRLTKEYWPQAVK